MQIDCDKGYTSNAIKFACLTNWQKWGWYISSYFSFKKQTYKMLLHAFNKIQSFYKVMLSTCILTNNNGTHCLEYITKVIYFNFYTTSAGTFQQK